MRSILRIILLFFISISTFSQGICDLTSANNIELGDFDAPAVVCIGQQFNVVDKSGGTEIKYIFKYKGQPVADLPTIPFESGPNSNWAFAETGDLLILQYGKKNGKKMYRCKVITVRDSNIPDVSYEACNNSVIRLTIRNTPSNNFSSYKIKWSDGVIVNIPGTTTLPFTVQKTFSTPSTTQNVLVEGSGSATANCPAATPLTIKMDRGEMFPRIEKIDLNADGTEATITLKGNPDAEYDIFSRPIDQGGNLANPLPNKVKAGTFKIPVNDKTKSQCFSVGRIGDICTEYSNEVCTMPFKLEADEEDYKISWNGFTIGKILNTAVYTYINQTEVKIIREENTGGTTVFNTVSSPYTDNTADCNKKYCYTLSTKITSSYSGYTGSNFLESATVSQTQCVDRKKIVPIALTETLVTVKDNNSVEINFTDNSTWNLDREKFRLHRLNNNKFEKIDSILSTSSKIFLDAMADPTIKSYCYAIDFIDKCGSTSALSPAFCTIFLSEANQNELIWTDKTPFGNSDISIYEVQSYDENTDVPSMVTSLPATQLTYIPDLSGFEEEAEFRIKTIAPGGRESYSNAYTIPLTVKLLLPDAFTPNNDAINDKLELKGTFRRISKFDFQIFNRWGNPVFTSTDPLKSWDGNFQGASSPDDTYTYKIYAKLFDGTEINKTGWFLLMR